MLGQMAQRGGQALKIMPVRLMTMAMVEGSGAYDQSGRSLSRPDR